MKYCNYTEFIIIIKVAEYLITYGMHAIFIVLKNDIYFM